MSQVIERKALWRMLTTSAVKTSVPCISVLLKLENETQPFLLPFSCMFRDNLPFFELKLFEYGKEPL